MLCLRSYDKTLPIGPISLTHTHAIAAYAALNARMTGSALIPGLPVPTADAGAMDAM